MRPRFLVDVYPDEPGGGIDEVYVYRIEDSEVSEELGYAEFASTPDSGAFSDRLVAALDDLGYRLAGPLENTGRSDLGETRLTADLHLIVA